MDYSCYLRDELQDFVEPARRLNLINPQKNRISDVRDFTLLNTQIKKPPRKGAFLFGGERVCLTIVFRSPINNTNYPLQPSNGKLFNI